MAHPRTLVSRRAAGGAILILAVASCTQTASPSKAPATGEPLHQLPVIDSPPPPVVEQAVTTDNSATSAPAIDDLPPLASMPGPTTMSRVAGGYELKNRTLRVVISEKTGDVIYWGAADANRNSVFRHGVYASLVDVPEETIDGYIEKRDDQTWQFFGQDKAHQITWRKIYCLEKGSLLASLIIANDGPTSLTTAIQLRGDFPNLRITDHTPEQFTGHSAYGAVSVHGWNEFHPTPTSQPALPVLIQSDTKTLPPGERFAFTTEWKLTGGRNAEAKTPNAE